MSTAARITVLSTIAALLSACGRGAPTSPTSSASLIAPASPIADNPSTTLNGSVRDTGHRLLPGVTIEVIDGPSAGTSVVSGSAGQFSITGLFDDATQFRASKEGFIASTHAWNCSVATCPGPTNARPWLHFYLASSRTPELAGNYTLTFTVDPTLRGLPAEGRTRTYAGTLTAGRRPGTAAFLMAASFSSQSMTPRCTAGTTPSGLAPRITRCS